jgi:hypothetical protein
MIAVKNANVFRELLIERYHPKLIELMLWLLHRYDHIIITSGYRDNDNGVHGQQPCRGMDIRNEGLRKRTIWGVSDTNSKALCERLNFEWVYDSSRPKMKCAIVHDVGEGNHIHLQVHPNTEMI